MKPYIYHDVVWLAGASGQKKLMCCSGEQWMWNEMKPLEVTQCSMLPGLLDLEGYPRADQECTRRIILNSIWPDNPDGAGIDVSD